MRLLMSFAFCQIFVLFEATARASNISKEITFKVRDRCYNLQFEQAPSAVLSCKYPIGIEYKIRECVSEKVLEHATNEAELTCPSDDQWRMRFKTTSEIVTLFLKVRREQAGKTGVVSKYFIKNLNVDYTQAKDLENRGVGD